MAMILQHIMHLKIYATGLVNNVMMQNIPLQLSNIEIRAQMVRAIIPNFDHLKMIIRGY